MFFHCICGHVTNCRLASRPQGTHSAFSEIQRASSAAVSKGVDRVGALITSLLSSIANGFPCLELVVDRSPTFFEEYSDFGLGEYSVGI